MRVTRHLAAAMLALGLFAACGDDDGDSTPPSIVLNAPAHGATGVSRTTVATVTFSELVDRSSVNDATIVVTAQTVNPPSVAVSTPAVLTVNEDVVRVAPATEWPAGERIEVFVTTGVRDLAGNALRSPWSFSFDVEAGAP